MGDLIKGIEFLGIPMTIAIVVVGLFLILHVIGSILDFKGKVVPEIINMRGYLRRKKEEKEKQKKLLENVQNALDEMKQHYSPENIARRNEWMDWVNRRAEVYDEALDDLRSMKDTLLSNNELTLDLYINVNRNRIIDFASKVANEKISFSREEFNRIFKVYNEYEAILEQHGKTNGEVDVAYRIITEAYEHHMRNHTFIEDMRGYNR